MARSAANTARRPTSSSPRIIPKDPKRIYDFAKLMGENATLYWGTLGLDVVVLRFATTYGPGKTARHGNMGVTSQIIEQPASGQPFRIAQGGDEKDDFIYNKDSALGIYLATMAKNLDSRVFNIGTGIGVTLKDVAAILRKHLPNAVIEVGPGLELPRLALPDARRLRHFARPEGIGLPARIRSRTRHRRLSRKPAAAEAASGVTGQNMRDVLELPRLSLRERDRRWAAVRKEMAARDLDCLVLWGWPLMWDFCIANARYLCPVGGNAEFNVLVFPREGDPTCFVLMPTFLEGWRSAQDWVGDIRARKGTWADSVAERIKELKLDRGRIGMDGLAGPLDPDGWLPHSVYLRLQELLSGAKLVALDDMLEKVRTIKSDEELGMLAKAAELGDLMLAACRDTARPGVKECEVYGRMVETMLAHGGEEPTLFLWACDRYPYPHPFRVPTTRKMERGDVIICELHPKIGGYFTHVERTFCLGEPEAKQREIYDGCVAAYERGLKEFGPGRKISEAMGAVKQTIEDRKLAICETGIHGHGLASLEYPRYRFHALRADQDALKVVGDEFRPGMVFAFNIDLYDPAWRNGETGCVFAETVQITATGAQRMHGFSTKFQAIPV